ANEHPSLPHLRPDPIVTCMAAPSHPRSAGLSIVDSRPSSKSTIVSAVLLATCKKGRRSGLGRRSRVTPAGTPEGGLPDGRSNEGFVRVECSRGCDDGGRDADREKR